MTDGPLGLPRPLATSTVNISIDIRDGHAGMSEVAIEGAIRTPAQFPSADVTVSESFDHEGQIITVITRREEVSLSVIHNVLDTIRRVTEIDFNRRDVTVRTR